MILPELLAPAGSPEALAAAIEAGADAAYFGSTLFSCRMRAGNFDSDAMRAALSLCRAYGVRSYVTVNTRLRGGELADVLRLVDELYEGGVDALIATDLALVAEVRRRYPDLELHASTQVSGANADDAKALAELGFSRMVCPRELSREQIEELVKDSPIGIEMFIHGAHCASFSGQCLASFAMGGRSGNRGECAQPCRLAYSAGGKQGYPLSLKDMCLAGHIREIIASGAASLKIEGRQKSAGYVYGVTRIYRRLLDERRDATEAEIAELARLFSRDGFTDGYFTKNYHGMTGVRTAADAAVSRDAESFGGLSRKVPVTMKFRAAAGEPMELTVCRRSDAVTAKGEIPAEAVSRPLDADGAAKNLTKLGGTPYICESLTCDIAGGLWVTAAQLNALRRSAMELLDAVGTRKSRVGGGAENSSRSPRGRGKRTAEFQAISQIPEGAERFFDEIYIPADEWRTGCGYGINLPPAILSGDGFPEAAVRESGLVMAHSIGQIKRAKEAGAEVFGSYRMNVFNSAARDELIRIGCSEVTVSPELSLGAMRAIGGSAVVYGRLPLMLLMRCTHYDSCKKRGEPPRANIGVLSTEAQDIPRGWRDGKNICVKSLVDRTGARFPIIGDADCMNVLYNSVPVYMGDRGAELARLGGCHFIFTDETAAEATDVIRAYERGDAPAGAVRRVK